MNNISNNDSFSDQIYFDRKKIYENLLYIKEPENYSSKVPWLIQCQIADTNGKHYRNSIGKLAEIPTYELPVKKGAGVMLDIGCGWGRWLSAGYEKGYIPIGIDMRLEFCKASLQSLNIQNKNGYAVVADLENLPFKDNIFNLVWSYSVIQHTHKSRLINCLDSINRVLSNTGFTKLEFPNRFGIRNRFIKINKNDDNYNSWAVRYYSIFEYKKIINKYLSNFKYSNHSFIGIGVLKEDLNYLKGTKYLLTVISLFFSKITKFIPLLIRFSDSIYVTANKKQHNILQSNINNQFIDYFMDSNSRDPHNNLNIVPLLICPNTKSDLKIHDSNFLINEIGNWKYPIIDGIPILIKSEAIPV